jgi:hypothetical protein
MLSNLILFLSIILPTGNNSFNSAYNTIVIATLTITILFVLLVLKMFAQQIARVKNILR